MNVELAERHSVRAERAWDRIRRMRAVIEATSADGDRTRRLPQQVADAFMEADVYRLLVPEDLGGQELDLVTIFELGVEVSSYNGAAGWSFGIGCGGAALLGVLPLDRITEIYQTPDCCMAGSGTPGGKAVAVEGGYLVTGRWAWASAIYQSKWVAGSAVVHDGDAPRLGPDGKPIVRFVILPKDDVTVLDTWFTGGMRGTGSTEWEVKDVFVADANVCGQPYSGVSEHPAPVFRLPSIYFGLMLCAVGLGIARGAVDTLKDLARDGALKREGYAQYAVAKAQAIFESSYFNAREVARAIWETTVADLRHSVESRACARRAYCHAAESSVQAVQLCYDAAGGAAVFEASPLERAMRDVHTVSTHRILSRRFMEMAGQAAFDMPIDNPLF